jgi:DNA phosphorothioation-associated putative methyltransferase
MGNDISKAQGKVVAGRTYAHLELLSQLDSCQQELVDSARSKLPATAVSRYNVIRIDPEHREVGFLSYPGFFEDPFPALQESWKVRIDSGHVVYRTYAESLNPPILHRKERLLPAGHPAHPAFASLTATAEQAGLFDDTLRIGLKQQWEALLQRSGLTIVGHELVPVANDLGDGGTEPATASGPIARHLTALSRSYLSVPIQSLIRHGLLKPGVSVFDYGCGKGDDVRNLQSLGYAVSGWDPHYCPENPQQRADVVNLGFVINVIDDLDERCEAIERAFALTDRVLVVGALIGNPPTLGIRRHGDGVITSRNTFQKYYSPGELLQFVSAVLDQDALPAAPGVVYAFKDRVLETNYLLGRYANRGRVARALLPAVDRPTLPRVRARKPKRELPAEVLAALSGLWQVYLDLGRRPELAEVPDIGVLVGHFRTPGRVFRYAEATNDAEALARSASARRDDLLVGLSLQLFARRKRFRDLDDRLRLDIKSFFGTYDNAQREAVSLLQAIGDVARLLRDRDQAASAGLGHIDHDGHLQLHSSLVGRLPPLLRVYAGAATAAYGDLASTDLVKLHVRTGKVTLMAFDDFTECPLPRMRERVKVDLREQDLQVFEYGETFAKPYLYRKSRYINEEFPNYPEQQALDEQLEALGVLGESAYGPSPAELEAALEAKRWAIDGFRLVRSQRVPDLDEKCGRYLAYRQLIECGETWEATRVENCPKVPDSYTALYELAINVLDPVIEYFGAIRLTYGFCSPTLERQIKGRIAPKLDQHAACERTSSGTLRCHRQGAAVDFLIEDEDMMEVVRWIAGNTSFDRMYFYGPANPIHVSYGPQQSRSIVAMEMDDRGRRTPRVMNHMREQD